MEMTTAHVMNRELAYEFEEYVTIDLTFGSDTELYWKERASGANANETISTIHVNESTTLTDGWSTMGPSSPCGRTSQPGEHMDFSTSKMEP